MKARNWAASARELMSSGQQHDAIAAGMHSSVGICSRRR